MRFALVLLAIAVVAPSSRLLAQESTRTEFREFCKLIEGRWIGSTVLARDGIFGKEGERVTTYFDSNLASDGYILIGKYQSGEGTATWVVSYDPGSKQIKGLWVDSSGAYSEAVIKNESGKWTQYSKGMLSDGTSLSRQQSLAASDDNRTHTWSGTQEIDGQPPKSFKTVWKRVYK